MTYTKFHGITFVLHIRCETKRRYHEKKTYEILERLRVLIMSEGFKNSCRSSTRDFTRCCLLTFPMLILFILNLVRRSLQSELNKFIKIVSLSYISKQAFSAARKKLLPIAFIKLNNELINEFYSDNKFKTFYGFRVIVVDSSTLQLPESVAIRKKYGACSNQKQDNMTMSRISYAYDPLSEVTLDAIMSPYAIPERSMAFDHILNIQASNCAEDLYIFDRGYPAMTLMHFLNYNKKYFLMRCSESSWLPEITKLVKNRKKDEIIEINLKSLQSQQRTRFINRFPGLPIDSIIKIRIIIIKLPNGDREVLVTNLLDKNEYKYEMFRELYHLRWGAEENYKFHKVRIEIENFSGETTHAVEQDFHATVFAANIRALLAEEAQEELYESQPKKQSKHDYKINKNISAAILKDEVIRILMDPEGDLGAFCERLKNDMKKSVVPIRPGRHYMRIRKNKRKYPMNRRRAF